MSVTGFIVIRITPTVIFVKMRGEREYTENLRFVYIYKTLEGARRAMKKEQYLYPDDKFDIIKIEKEEQ